MKIKKWWAVVAGAVLGTAAVGTGAYVAKHRKRRKKVTSDSGRVLGENPHAQAPTPLDAVPGNDERVSADRAAKSPGESA